MLYIAQTSTLCWTLLNLCSYHIIIIIIAITTIIIIIIAITIIFIITIINIVITIIIIVVLVLVLVTLVKLVLQVYKCYVLTTLFIYHCCSWIIYLILFISSGSSPEDHVYVNDQQTFFFSEESIEGTIS